MPSLGLAEDSVYFHVHISVLIWIEYAKTAESGLYPCSRGIVLIVVVLAHFTIVSHHSCNW